jgi:putative addiction module component (TIGR02574 family)
MSAVAKKLLNEALALPADARLNLVEELLASLNLPPQPEVDKLWAKEAERRIAQIDKGEVAMVSGDKVFAKILKKHRR